MLNILLSLIATINVGALNVRSIHSYQSSGSSSFSISCGSLAFLEADIEKSIPFAVVEESAPELEENLGSTKSEKMATKRMNVLVYSGQSMSH